MKQQQKAKKRMKHEEKNVIHKQSNNDGIKLRKEV